MKVDSSSVWRDAFASNDEVRNASDINRPAFDQVLRVMEKEMWPGVEAGRMTGDRLPGQTRFGATTGFAGMSAFDADVGASARTASLASGDKLSTPTASRSVGSFRGLRFPATTATQQSGNGVAQPDAEVVLTAFEALSTLTPNQNQTVSTESRFTLPPSASTSTPRVTHSPVSPAAMPTNTESTAAPYRLTVMNGAASVSVALRVRATQADELEKLTQIALDELTSQGTRGVRLIVNGVEHIPTSSRGITHGY